MTLRPAARRVLLMTTLALGCSAPSALAGSTTAETVAPGGSVSTGSTVSPADPIQVKVTTERGGEVKIEKIDDPTRPAFKPSLDHDPNDSFNKQRLFYGPAIRITPPQMPGYDPCAIPRSYGQACAMPLGDPEGFQSLTVTILIDGASDLMDGRWRHSNLANNPVLTPSYSPITPERFGCSANGGKQTVHYTPAHDIELTGKYSCSNYPMTFDAFNLPFKSGGQNNGAGGGNSLTRVLKAKSMEAYAYCVQRCARSVTVTINKKTAKKLGISTTLGSASAGEFTTLKDTDKQAWTGLSLPVKLSAKQVKALKRASRLNVVFHFRLIDAKGKVHTDDSPWTYKGPEGDAIN